ncbi:MAG: hypothetical protein RIR71_518 [Actinomycetota bacterium]
MEPALRQLLAEDRLEQVEVEEGVPKLELDVAFRHHKTAQLAAAVDPEGAFQLLYESARKALQAVLFTKGLRVRRPPRGNHYTYVLVSRTDLVDQEAWRPLNWMRELRNETEYWDPDSVAAKYEDVIQALAFVSKMLDDATNRLEAHQANIDPRC